VSARSWARLRGDTPPVDSIHRSHRRVAVVLDKAYGARVDALATRVPVWMVDSADNRRAAAAYEASQARRDPTSHPVALCLFPSPSRVEDQLLEIVRSIIALDADAPAGEFPYPILSVIGLEATDTMRASLREYGLTSTTKTRDGFVATRSPE
jgi:hypothetical protein